MKDDFRESISMYARKWKPREKKKIRINFKIGNYN